MMDFDIDNMAALKAGANAYLHDSDDGFSAINTAPRDGSIVEIKCKYGVVPWYGLFRWSDQGYAYGNQGLTECSGWPLGWRGGGQSAGSNVDEGPYLLWKPFVGDPSAWKDPRGEYEVSAAYERGAIAAKYSLPLDYFEKETAKNVGSTLIPKPVKWWQFWRMK